LHRKGFFGCTAARQSGEAPQWRMSRKKPGPDVIGLAYRFSEKDMRKRKDR